jgi:tetratricopeptide (TPR) repeat protein
MEEPLVKKKSNLEIFEIAAIVSSFGGSIAAIVLQQAALAYFPISTCLALNFVNRKNLRQDMALFHETTLFKIDRQITSSQEKTDRSLEKVMLAHDKLNENLIQNKQELENVDLELQKQQTRAANILDRVRDIALASQAINGNPKTAEYYCQRGLNYEQLGYKQGAIYDYTKAIEVDPACAKAFYQRGLVYSELGERKAALEDLRRAAKFYFDNGELVEYQKARDLSQELYDLDADEKDDDRDNKDKGEAVVLKGFMS